jgi:hypothetical protein
MSVPKGTQNEKRYKEHVMFMAFHPQSVGRIDWPREGEGRSKAELGYDEVVRSESVYACHGSGSTFNVTCARASRQTPSSLRT